MSHSAFVSSGHPLVLTLGTHSPHGQPCAEASPHIPVATCQKNENKQINIMYVSFHRKPQIVNFHWAITTHETDRVHAHLNRDMAMIKIIP